MRGLGREEEELEDTVSHLSIYLTSLDQLYREQAAQLKQPNPQGRKGNPRDGVTTYKSHTSRKLPSRSPNPMAKLRGAQDRSLVVRRRT
jgi:hypothetical protein